MKPKRKLTEQEQHIPTDLRTFGFGGCTLTIRYDDDGVAYFELWIPGAEEAEPVATVPHTGGQIEWSNTAHELLEDSDYADEIVAILEDYERLPGDRTEYTFDKKWCAWKHVAGESEREDDDQ